MGYGISAREPGIDRRRLVAHSIGTAHPSRLITGRNGHAVLGGRHTTFESENAEPQEKTTRDEQWPEQVIDAIIEKQTPEYGTNPEPKSLGNFEYRQL